MKIDVTNHLFLLIIMFSAHAKPYKKGLHYEGYTLRMCWHYRRRGEVTLYLLSEKINGYWSGSGPGLNNNNGRSRYGHIILKGQSDSAMRKEGIDI